MHVLYLHVCCRLVDSNRKWWCERSVRHLKVPSGNKCGLSYSILSSTSKLPCGNRASVCSGCVHFSLGWGAWADWGDCDDEGLQHRSRHCGEDQEAEASLCQGNVTQSRKCRPHEVPGEQTGDMNCWKSSLHGYKRDAREKISWPFLCFNIKSFFTTCLYQRDLTWTILDYTALYILQIKQNKSVYTTKNKALIEKYDERHIRDITLKNMYCTPKMYLYLRLKIVKYAVLAFLHLI